MTPNYRNCRTRENGLSEVVGFVLILGVLVLVFSLYLTYGIPAQGRENEILHMNEVKDQFVSYKLSMDSLLDNNKIGSSASNSFTLGTGGGYTQGMMSIVPVMSPISSTGVIAINQRVPGPGESLNISSKSLIANTSRPPVGFAITAVPAVYTDTSPPSGITVYIDTTLASADEMQRPYSVTVNGTQRDNANWVANVSLTPRFSQYNETQSVNCAAGPSACVITYNEGYRYNRTDLTVSVVKNGVKSIDEYIINANIGKANYSVNILDDTYGLRPFVTVSSIQFTEIGSTSGIKSNGKITYLYQDEVYRYPPINLGALEYRAQNNYWIPQNYYYQMGGVFLQQYEGNVSYKLPPDLSIFFDNNTKIMTVDINAINFANTTGIAGGNSPVQIKTSYVSKESLPYAPLNNNTKWVRIGVNTSDVRANAMWEDYFDYTARVAGIPQASYKVNRLDNESYILINDTYPDSNDIYGIRLTATNATYAATIQGVGGVLH
jgi:hypothetical protein